MKVFPLGQCWSLRGNPRHSAGHSFRRSEGKAKRNRRDKPEVSLLFFEALSIRSLQTSASSSSSLERKRQERPTKRLFYPVFIYLIIILFWKWSTVEPCWRARWSPSSWSLRLSLDQVRLSFRSRNYSLQKRYQIFTFFKTLVCFLYLFVLDEKLATCCEVVSNLEITEPITGYMIQKRNPPCVQAVM